MILVKQVTGSSMCHKDLSSVNKFYCILPVYNDDIIQIIYMIIFIDFFLYIFEDRQFPEKTYPFFFNEYIATLNLDILVQRLKPFA